MNANQEQKYRSLQNAMKANLQDEATALFNELDREIAGKEALSISLTGNEYETFPIIFHEVQSLWQFSNFTIKQSLDIKDCTLSGRISFINCCICNLRLCNVSFANNASVFIEGLESRYTHSTNSILIENIKEGKLHFEKFQPIKSFCIENSTIKSIDLKGIQAIEVVNFANTSFKSNPEFGPNTHQVSFLDQCTFENGLEIDLKNIDSSLNFSKCHFKKDISISKEIETKNFHKVHFENCYGEIDLLFKQVNFRDLTISNFGLSNITFLRCDIFMPLLLSNMTTILNLSFYKTTLSSLCLESIMLKTLRLNDSKFSNDLKINKSNIELCLASSSSFSELKILKSQFIKSAFTSCTFNSETLFESVTFLSYPEFFESKFFPHFTFAKCNFQDTKSIGADNAYRHLKGEMAKLNDDSTEMMFSALELSSRRKRLSWLSDFWEIVFSWLYRGINNYGQSLILPFVWQLVLWSWVGLIYSWDSNVVLNKVPQSTPKTLESWYTNIVDDHAVKISNQTFDFRKGYYYATTSLIVPLKLFDTNAILLPRTWFLQLISLLHGVISTLLWYMGIVGIKRRFKTL